MFLLSFGIMLMCMPGKLIKFNWNITYIWKTPRRDEHYKHIEIERDVCVCGMLCCFSSNSIISSYLMVRLDLPKILMQGDHLTSQVERPLFIQTDEINRQG